MAENEKGEKGDYGIGEDDMDYEIITELSPRLYLHEHGITVQKTCNCQGGDELGKYEIRLDPSILTNMEPLFGYVIDFEYKIGKIESVYESIVTQDEFEYWAFVKAKIPVRFSEKIDINAVPKCENLKDIKVFADEKIDSISAFEAGYVIRLFYSSIEDCFNDFKKIFKGMYASVFRDTLIDFEFKNVDNVVITETCGQWVMGDSDLKPNEEED